MKNFGYITGSEAEELIASKTLSFDEWLERITKLEDAVNHDNGIVHEIKRELEATRGNGPEGRVMIAGMIFDDAMATESWVRALDKDNKNLGKNLPGSSVVPLMADMKVQLSEMFKATNTVGQFFATKADAHKANFESEIAGRVTSTFEITYPEVFFKASTNMQEVTVGGFKFQPSFGSEDAFEGTSEFSPLRRFLNNLRNNRDRTQQSINARFPSHEPKSARPNAVLSEILRMGYFQAVGFLQSLLPFSKMMTKAGLSPEVAWTKCLTYALAVFERIHEVRTTALLHTPGSMLYGMMRATRLLQTYTEIGWIRHPDVSSALVMAALQRQGAENVVAMRDPQVNTNKSGVATNKAGIASNKTKITNLENQVKRLIDNNSLNT